MYKYHSFNYTLSFNHASSPKKFFIFSKALDLSSDIISLDLGIKLLIPISFIYIILILITFFIWSSKFF